jgi:hypothetical protein
MIDIEGHFPAVELAVGLATSGNNDILTTSLRKIRQASLGSNCKLATEKIAITKNRFANALICTLGEPSSAFGTHCAAACLLSSKFASW